MSIFDLAERATSLSAATRLHVGVVRIATADELIVLAEDTLWPASRAASCLVQPEAGDTVLLLAAEGREFTVLNVLERASRSGLSIAHEDGIILRGPTLSLIAEEALQVRAPHADLEITTLNLRSAAATLVAKAASALVETLRTVATRIEQTSQSLLIQATHRTAVIDGVDTLDARAANSRIETLVIQTNAAVVTAEQDIRIDAERIALG